MPVVSTNGRTRGPLVRSLAALLAVAVLGAVACRPAEENRAGDVLNLAFSADMPGGADPDSFYDVEGLQVTTAVYQGLLRYDVGAKRRIVGDLARSWRVSADGRTVTFELRKGVRFHDGTVFDASAMKKSLERRTAVDAGPAYMLADVSRIETPDAQTLVVRLKRRNNAFLDHLAGPYGPKAVSPKAVDEHAKGDDHAAAWLTAHDAGTGPYEITEFSPGRQIVLSAASEWDGPTPRFETVNIRIITDVSSQVQQLQGGQLQLLSQRIPPSQVAMLEETGSLTVRTLPAAQKLVLAVNADAGPFEDAGARQALQAAVDRKTIVEAAYADTATLADGFYPDPALNEDGALFRPGGTARQLADVDEKVDIGYFPDGAAVSQAAQLLQTQLAAYGVTATTRAISPAQSYELPTRPNLRPDLYLSTNVPDDLSGDAWASIFFASDGPVNWLGCSSKRADAEMRSALHAPDAETSASHYQRAAQLVMDKGCMVPIADVNAVIVAAPGVAPIVHTLAEPRVVRLERVGRS